MSSSIGEMVDRGRDRLLGTLPRMICSSCGAPLDDTGLFPGGALKCACGASVTVPMPSPSRAAPDSVTRPSDATNACPRCDGALAVRHSEGLVVAACSKGHGIFITHAVLREAKREGPMVAGSLDGPAARRELAEGDADPSCHCPRCGEVMDRRSFAPEGAPVIVDVCASHGTWFDSGELRAALTAKTTTKTDPDLDKQANATLDVALALEQARDEDALRRGIDTADDVLDTFNFLVLGRGRRRTPWL